jgi:sterol desaturase/sphingolipid hydroxylase (fatty acid hydroxylase superfamily)
MMMVFWPMRIFEMPTSVWSGVLLFVLYDFAYYWKHRFAHRIRWFWTEHVTHHSSERYNLTTALRQPWFGPLTGLIWIGSPLVVMGFHPAFIAFVAGLNLLYQFWIHTEAIDRMPNWFEAVLNTPSHHRVHHATNPRYLDANYAGVFIIWDRLFGTFVKEIESDPPTFGIVTPVRSYNPLKVAFHELAALISDCARDGLRPPTWAKRFIYPPGWSPDGRHVRSEDIRKRWRETTTSPTETD